MSDNDSSIEQVFACWCGHTEEQHGPKDHAGFHRETACLICPGHRCDEVEWGKFEYMDRTSEHDVRPFDFEKIKTACLGHKNRVEFRFPHGSRTGSPVSGMQTREEYEAKLPRDILEAERVAVDGVEYVGGAA